MEVLTKDFPSKDHPPVCQPRFALWFCVFIRTKAQCSIITWKGKEVIQKLKKRGISEKDMAQILTLVSWALHSLKKLFSVPAEGDILSCSQMRMKSTCHGVFSFHSFNLYVSRTLKQDVLAGGPLSVFIHMTRSSHVFLLW